MNQCNPILFTELNQWLILERCKIANDNSVRTTKPRYNVFKETNDHLVRSIPGRDSLYPLSEVICGSQDPCMLATGRGMNFIDKI
jgi:hypothetical protein